MRPIPWWAFAAALLSWSAGVMAVILLSPGIQLLALAVAAAAVLWLLRRDMVFTICLALAALLLGAGRAALSPAVALPAGIAGSDVSLAGTVDDQPQSRRNSTRLSLRVDQLPGVQRRDFHNLRVQASV
ncbi:MAG: hypothetical protein M3Z13_01475, partial [Candidatus Dormibacteraeota bacterium]|nr:hypothetical protein [Candidatus Dormibacteraeota bacterium]